MKKTNPRLMVAVIMVVLIGVRSVQADIFIIRTAVNPANGHTYHLIAASPDGSGRSAGVSWSQAEEYAQTNFISHLATINDAVENEWVVQTFTNHSENGFDDWRIGIFIGYTDANQEGVWNWISGETPGFENWLPGEPDGAYPLDGTADYALLRPYGFGGSSDWGKWFDAHDVGSPATTGGYIPNYGLIEVAIEIELLGLEIIGPNEVAENSQAQYQAIAHYEGGISRDVTKYTVWSVEPETLANIDAGLLQTGDVEIVEDVNILATYTKIDETVEADKIISIKATFLNYPETILANNPIGYWRLDETSGTQAWDSSGNGFHGTYYGGVTLGEPGAAANPAPDTAVLFDGTSGYIDVGVEPNLYNLPGEFTVEAWIKPSHDADLGMILSTRRYTGTPNYGGYGFSASSGELRFSSFGMHYYKHWYSFPSDEWTHVVAVFDSAATVSFYINGEWQKDVLGKWHYAVVAEPFTIGRNPTPRDGNYDYFNGAIDEIAVYHYALTDDQIQAHYSAAILTNLEIVGPNEVVENSQSQYQAIAYYDNNSTGDVTALADWSVEPNDIASISAGLLTIETMDLSEYITITAKYGIEDTLTILAMTYAGAVVDTLDEAVDEINNLDPNTLKNSNMANALTNKIDEVLAMIDAGLYEDALGKLQNDILKKTDGCANNGEPDKNDWIKTCEEQSQIYPLVTETIEYVIHLME